MLLILYSSQYVLKHKYPQHEQQAHITVGRIHLHSSIWGRLVDFSEYSLWSPLFNRHSWPWRPCPYLRIRKHPQREFSKMCHRLLHSSAEEVWWRTSLGSSDDNGVIRVRSLVTWKEIKDVLQIEDVSNQNMISTRNLSEVSTIWVFRT